jgi:hypothetical protein
MSFADLSSDAIVQILQYLDGVDILRLISTGNRKVRSKAERVEKVYQEGWPFMKMPISLFKLPFVHTILINLNQYCEIYPWRLNGALPLPPMPLKSLTRLTMYCAQSFSVLKLDNGVPILDTYLLNLKSLVLGCSTVIVNETHLEALPQGLIELELYSRTVPQSEPPILCATLNKLPPHLEVLCIMSPVILVGEDPYNYESLVWPVGLRRLRLDRVDPCMFHNLPPSIEDLTLLVEPNDFNSVKMPLTTDLLPASLTKVIVTARANGYSEPLSFHPTTFPPNLLLCNLPFDLEATSAADWIHLPRSITKMSISPHFHTICPLHIHLPNLEQWTGLYGPQAHPDSLLQNLPQNLRFLLVSNISLERITTIPSKVAYLCANLRPGPQNPLIEDSSPSFTTPVYDVSRLPVALLELNISATPKGEKFSKIDFGFLPQHLQALSFSFRDIEDVETLLAIPRSIKTISIDVVKSCGLSDNPRLMEYMPTNIRSLFIALHDPDTAWRDWISTIGNWSQLERLSITSRCPSALPVDLDLIFKLPKSLKSVRLPVSQSNLKPEHMERLPKGLCSLTFYADYTEQSPICASDECFAKIPTSLCRLFLPTKTQGLTSKLFEILSPNIVYIHGPQIVEELKSAFFHRNWEGYYANTDKYV